MLLLFFATVVRLGEISKILNNYFRWSFKPKITCPENRGGKIVAKKFSPQEAFIQVSN